ncbi:putative MPP superfamily phosphohydrolase [Alkalihalobacillus xiaoxiensis]|uniref:MPP superfamily phosphohydrolase n=1 Tax=Shouchella xiaoxiensis TaxID=766895 RepID=A0ABS2ST83_9BACI|nr:metallophosphoesterase [Shouchella xiaoxiensis]MBM7838735.1 putative MPP superfamily phosphohydrolase [Shouchella xiaoxiensis]
MTTILTATLALLIYALACFYVSYNGWRWLNTSFSFPYKKSYFFVLSFLASAYILSYFVPFAWLELVGGYWLALFAYSLFLLPIANIIYFLSKKKKAVLLTLGYTFSALFTFVLIYGSFNAWSPVVRHYEVALNNESRSVQSEELRVLLAADLHIGNQIGEKHVQRFVDVVKDEAPDLVLLAGDIIDNTIDTFMEENLVALFEEIDSPLGVFVVPGNHDYYGGDLLLLKDEFQEIGIHFLMDQQVDVNGLLTIVGRKDFTDPDRLSIEELIEETSSALPIIMLDHQPRDISEARDSGVDLIVSGHTHRAQLWPGHLITQQLYENDWGYKQFDQLHSFTTSGFGFWGPALRIGSRSEVMVVDLQF